MKSLKLLGLVVLLMGVSGCESKFPSKTQAIEGCDKWKREGDSISYQKVDKEGKTWVEKPEEFCLLGKCKMTEEIVWTRPTTYKTITDYARSCKREEETNQVLGYENKSIQNGTWVDGDDARKEIVKHFRY